MLHKLFGGIRIRNPIRNVCDSEPYRQDVSITKVECVDHVQKRMRKRLMEKIKQCKGKVYTWKCRKT